MSIVIEFKKTVGDQLRGTSPLKKGAFSCDNDKYETATEKNGYVDEEGNFISGPCCSDSISGLKIDCGTMAVALHFMNAVIESEPIDKVILTDFNIEGGKLVVGIKRTLINCRIPRAELSVYGSGQVYIENMEIMYTEIRKEHIGSKYVSEASANGFDDLVVNS